MTNPEPTDPTPQNEGWEIFKGMLLLLGCHALAGTFIFVLGFVVALVASGAGGGYGFIYPWAIGAAGFLFWQLLYVIPLIIRLRQRGRIAMSKGVIIAAVLTALVNGACFVTMFGIGR